MKTGIQHALPILLVALSFPSEALAETPVAAAPDTVTPKFSWQPGLKAAVTFTTSRTRVVDKRTTTATEGRYTLSVIAEGPHLRIHISDPKLGKKGSAPTPDSMMTQARIIEQLAAMAPDFVVARIPGQAQDLLHRAHAQGHRFHRGKERAGHGDVGSIPHVQDR